MSDDMEVSRKYRELEAQEPPPALDEAILAAARRETGARPGSLASGSNRQRWYAPMATAAVLVLSVAVTLNMQIERPGIESPAPVASEETKPKSMAEVKSAAKPAAESGASARRRDVGQASSTPPAAPAPAAPPAMPAEREPQPFAKNQAPARAASRADDARVSQAPAPIVTGEPARQLEERTLRDAEAASRATMGAVQSLAKRAERAEGQEKLQAAKPGDTPERELERIVELRAQGRHEEADKALAEFRRRYPDFRIPDATRERVERR